MRVAMYYSNNDVRIEDMPKPKAGPGEMVMRVEASGICGSDVMEWYRVDRVPLVLGHEVSGVVDEVGKGVKCYKKGDRIVAAHHVPCGKCRYCTTGHETVCETIRKTAFHPGGFSEYIRLPEINVKKGVFRIPEGVSFEEATFTEPLACVLRGQRMTGVKKGDAVLIIGSGVSGVIHIALAKFRGAKVIATDISDFRLAAAKKFGADEVINGGHDVPGNIAELTNGVLADVVIVCAGAPKAIEDALKSVRRGGTILFFAATNKGVTIPFSINQTFWRTEVTLTSSYAGSPKEHEEALKLIKSKKLKLKEMITHRLPLSETGEGFRLVSSAKDSIKIIITPQK